MRGLRFGFIFLGFLICFLFVWLLIGNGGGCRSSTAGLGLQFDRLWLHCFGITRENMHSQSRFIADILVAQRADCLNSEGFGVFSGFQVLLKSGQMGESRTLTIGKWARERLRSGMAAQMREHRCCAGVWRRLKCEGDGL